MPIITFDGPRLSKEQKIEMVKAFTKTASEVTKMPEQAFIVLLKESDAENVGVGGTLLSERNK